MSSGINAPAHYPLDLSLVLIFWYDSSTLSSLTVTTYSSGDKLYLCPSIRKVIVGNFSTP